MRRLRLLLAFALVGAASGAGAGVLAARTPRTTLPICGNTYCAPGDTFCWEYDGWGCSLSNGCSGTQRCD